MGRDIVEKYSRKMRGSLDSGNSGNSGIVNNDNSLSTFSRIENIVEAGGYDEDEYERNFIRTTYKVRPELAATSEQARCGADGIYLSRKREASTRK